MNNGTLIFEISRLQGPFRHGKTHFFKNIWTNKSCKINLTFTSKNPFAILSVHSKVMDEFQKGVGMNKFLNTFKHPL